MLTRIKLAVIVEALLLAVAWSATQSPPAGKPLAIPDADAKMLVGLSAQIDAMGKDIDKAQKQAEDAARLLNEANMFIANYNRLLADRQALIYRQAADVCGCKSSELELAPDGKSILRKPAVKP